MKPQTASSLRGVALCIASVGFAQLANLDQFIQWTNSAHGAEPGRPNVVLIYTDDQGYGDASCLNPKSKFATPNLDRMAREGITFRDAHCSDTVCTPSRYGLLTGRYSWRTHLKRGVFGAEAECLIADGRTTIASLAKQAGYTTAMVGKWHLGMTFPGDFGKRDWTMPVTDMPLDKGFDYYYGIPASMNYGVLAWFEGRFAKTPPLLFTQKKPNQIALADYRIMPPYDRQAKIDNNGKSSKKTSNRNQRLEVAEDFVDSECLTRFTDKAIAWMKQHANTNPDKPFLLYLPYTSPHKPVIPIDPFRGKSDAGAYGDFMMETDAHVGRVLKTLNELGIGDDTLVIFTSDNGPETTWKARAEKYSHRSNGIYREGKRSIYEGGHRVPMFIRWPGGIAERGRYWDQPVCQTDILATLAELWQIKLPDNAGEDSVSFHSVLKHADPVKTPPRPPVIHHASSGRFAIRHGDWKLVMPGSSPTGKKRPKQGLQRELYNLKTDPQEKSNVITDHADRAETLERLITNIVISGRSTPGTPQRNDTGWWSDLPWMERFERE